MALVPRQVGGQKRTFGLNLNPLLGGGGGGGGLGSAAGIDELVEGVMEGAVRRLYALSNSQPLTPPLLYWSTPKIMHLNPGEHMCSVGGPSPAARPPSRWPTTPLVYEYNAIGPALPSHSTRVVGLPLPPHKGTGPPSP